MTTKAEKRKMLYQLEQLSADPVKNDKAIKLLREELGFVESKIALQKRKLDAERQMWSMDKEEYLRLRSLGFKDRQIGFIKGVSETTIYRFRSSIWGSLKELNEEVKKYVN